MSQNQVNSIVESRINKDRVGGYSIDQLWAGIHPGQRYMVAFSLKSLIDAGKVEVTEKRVFDGAGNPETVTSYRKIWK